MFKNTFQSVLILLSFLPLLCTAAQVLQRNSFYVVFDRNLTPEDARNASLSGTVAGRKQKFSMPGNNKFNLKKLCKSYIKVKDAAIVSFVISASEKGHCYLGIGADFWFTCFLDGKLIGTTEPRGEGSADPSFLNHFFKTELKKGENRFFVHTRPGAASWLFSCGILPDFDKWPADHIRRQKLFNQAFPSNTVYGPFVTRVSTDKATISLEYRIPVAAELRYKVSGSGEKYKILAPQPFYGLLPRKKLHRFDLTGLTPGKKYEFEISDREKIPGGICSGTFSTLPEQKSDHVLTAISDTQTTPARRTELIHSMIDKGMFKNSDLLVALGDVSSTFNDFNENYLATFLIPFRNKGVTLPFYPVRGNHEYRGSDTGKFLSYFGCPYYAFRYGDVLYIVLDTGEDKTTVYKSGHYTLLTDTKKHFQEQKIWLENLIQSPMCKTAKKRIVLAHAPPFEWENKYYAANIESFASVFFGPAPRCTIDLWLCGDIHSPYRFDPVTGELSGAPRKANARRKLCLTANDRKNIRFPVYVNDGPGGAGQNYSVTRLKVSADTLHITCTGEDGTVMDEVILRKGRPFEVKKTVFQKYIPYKK